MNTQSHIRNFAIIAHIDHGKSTLADRLLELTGTIQKRDMQAQVLDSNPIERERGITIKLAPVRMTYTRQQIQNSKSKIRNKSQIQNSNSQKGFGFRNLDFELSNSAYTLNLIDTPGHVDFGYEVSRSLAACEGALLVVDATQGVQAQTLANLYQARAHHLTIIPIINKIDMPTARVEETGRELEALGFPPLSPITPLSPICISAKTGENVDKVLEAIIDRIPSPKGAPTGTLRALVFSSQYDAHKGVVVFVRVVDGSLHCDIYNNSILFLASNAKVAPIEIGYFMPQMQMSKGLENGEVGYIATGLKDVRFAKVGDTITTMPNDKCQTRPPARQVPNEKQKFSIGHWPFSITPLAGYREPKPMVFLSLFPINSDEFSQAREAMEKLRLSDSAFTFRPISSLALGNGFHCGFLGLLHAEIVQERLSREFGLNMIATAPSVEYHLHLKPGVSLSKLGFTESQVIRNPQSVTRKDADYRLPITDYQSVSIQSAAEFPDPTYIDEVKEPMMRVTVYAPSGFVGAIMQLCQEKRGEYIDTKYLHGASDASSTSEVERENRTMVEMEYLMPLSEMIIDFFDRLKSISEGYASLDYEFFDFQSVDVVKVDILVNKEKVDALSLLVVKDQAHRRGAEIADRLSRVIPRQQFEIPIQAAIGGSVIARADVKAFRKDVIQKLYGGDRTRKDKLLEAQKKGKARMKLVGRVEIPQSAFFQVLKNE